jgi:hypothetical protein
LRISLGTEQSGGRALKGLPCASGMAHLRAPREGKAVEYSTVTLFIAEQIHERYMVNAAVATD